MQTDDVEHTEKPKLGRTSNTVHGRLGHALDILDAPFNRVLMFIVGFGLTVTNAVEAVEGLDTTTGFRLGIIRHEAKWSASLADEIFESRGHIGFRGHGVTSKVMRIKTGIELKHCGTPVTGDAIIMSRDIAEDGVSRDPFIQATYIGSRKAGFEVLSEGMMDSGTVVLGRSIQGGFNALNRNPGKVGAKDIKAILNAEV